MKSLYKVWETRKKTRENKESYIKKFNQGGKAFANIKCAFNSNLLINNSGVLYNTTITSEYFFIPIENLKVVQVKTDEEMSKHIIESKMPLIGGLSFPQKIHFFLIMNYIEADLKIEKTIETENALLGATSILKAIHQYNENHPNSLIEELDCILKPSSLNENLKAMDIPDQINKLFELVDKGALSLEEFDQKKKELLLKM